VETGFDQIYREYDRQRQMKIDGEFISKFVMSLKSGSSVLDVGCGSGKVARLLNDGGHTVTGIDISRKMLNLARENAPQSKFYRIDIREMDFKANSFDGIVCLYAIISLPRKWHLSILRRFYKILKPGGLMLINVGLSELKESVGDFYGAKMYWSHFGKEKNFELIRKAGFQIKQWKTLGSKNDRHVFIIALKSNA